MSTVTRPTLMVIDGHSLAFRAFYALPVENFVTASGQHTGAIHGFLSMLIKLLQDERPDALAVAFDVSRHSFRTEEYPEYKGTRGETPPEFVGQVPLIQETLHAIGIRTLEKEHYEADDILATLAARGSQAGYRVLVVSGDRDTIQLVNDQVTLLYPSTQGVSKLTRFDTQKVYERYGVRPEQYPEIAALVGEKSDNLPGVPLVGEKTAMKWLTQFGSLNELLRRRDELGGKAGANLREYAHLVERNRRLNRLLTNVELDVELDQLTRGPVDLHTARPVFDKFEFHSLWRRLVKLTEESSAAAIKTPVPPKAKRLQGAALGEWLRQAECPALVIAQSESAVKRLLPHAQQDLERGIEVGISTPEETVLLRWQPGGQGDAAFEAWLASNAPKLCWNTKQQLAFAEAGGVTVGGIVGDGLLASWLLRPGEVKVSLADAVFKELGEQMPQPDPKQPVSVEETLEFAGVQAWYLVRLHAEMVQRFPEKTATVYRDIELPLTPVLHALESRGVQVDLPVLHAHEEELRDRVAVLEARAFAEIGREVNLSSPKQLQEVLFDQLEMPKTRKIQQGYSTDAAALTELQRTHPHPFLDVLLEHRDVNKLHQIVATLLKSVRSDGRIHTTLLQTAAATGRLASADPNLQNIPVRTNEGRRIREAFIHGPDYETLMTADYSQIEMRIMAHLSGDTGLIDAFHAGEDLHRFVGSRVFNVSAAEVTPAMRSKVKAMSYGLVYGLSAFGLAKQLGIDAAEARQLMSDYFERFGGVRDYLRTVVEQARINGYTETMCGRRRPFAELRSPNRMRRESAERAALNSPIQGSAADLIKIAMMAVERRMRAQALQSRMLLQIHDELMFEVAAGEWDVLEGIVREEMGNAATLTVPLVVQLGGGANWNAAAH